MTILNSDQTTKLYLRNLPPTFDGDDVESLLANFSPQQIRVPRDHVGNYLGMAFVRVPSGKVAAALNYLDGLKVDGHVLHAVISNRQ
jgi:RNA recognition motif-containing protein